MASVFKRTADRTRKGASWYIAYVDAEGIRRTVKGCPDRVATEQMAGKLTVDVALQKAGLIDPRDVAFRDADRTAVDPHLDVWKAHMLAKGRLEKHARLFRGRAGRVVALTAAKRLSDLSPTKIQAALDALRAEGLSNQTATHARSAMRAFCKWAQNDGRLRSNPMAGVNGFNAKEDVRLTRRSLTPEELGKLIEAASLGFPYRRVDGPTRAMVYRIAAATGFRAGEIRALTRESFHLNGEPPRIVLPPEATKNRKGADQPIPKALAEALASWIAGRPEGKPLIRLPDYETARMMRVDLKAAGIAYETPEGVADFHSLRGYFVSSLVQSGASIKAVQTLARHSTPVTTLAHYAKVGILDITGAVESLPDPMRKPQSPRSEPMAATGTNDQIRTRRYSAGAAREGHLGTIRDAEGRDEASSSNAISLGAIKPQSPSVTAHDGECRPVTAIGEAEGVGFEPTDVLRRQRFSRPPRSTTLPPLQVGSG